MTPILLYGFPLGSSMGLVAALEWLGQPYRLSRVDMLNEMKNKAYARINDRLETPVLITADERVLTETMAIALWLEARDVKRNTSFEPKTVESERMHQFMAFLNTGFTAAFAPLWIALEMNPPNEPAKKVYRELGCSRVIERHNRLEAMLGDTPYLVGDRPTLADALLIGVSRWLDFHQIADIDRWPRLAALRRRIEALPAVQFAMALELDQGSPNSEVFLGHVALSDIITRFGT